MHQAGGLCRIPDFNSLQFRDKNRNEASRVTVVWKFPTVELKWQWESAAFVNVSKSREDAGLSSPAMLLLVDVQGLKLVNN